MQEQCALNKHLTFIISMKSVVCSFVRQFDCVTVIKSTSTQKVLQPIGKDMQRRIQNTCKTSKMELFAKIVNGLE